MRDPARDSSARKETGEQAARRAQRFEQDRGVVFDIGVEFAKALRAIEAETTNRDAALSAMTRELRLPDEATFSIFALARMVGWLAHAMEQRDVGRIIRPRARYVGD